MSVYSIFQIIIERCYSSQFQFENCLEQFMFGCSCEENCIDEDECLCLAQHTCFYDDNACLKLSEGTHFYYLYWELFESLNSPNHHSVVFYYVLCFC